MNKVIQGYNHIVTLALFMTVLVSTDEPPSFQGISGVSGALGFAHLL